MSDLKSFSEGISTGSKLTYQTFPTLNMDSYTQNFAKLSLADKWSKARRIVEQVEREKLIVLGLPTEEEFNKAKKFLMKAETGVTRTRVANIKYPTEWSPAHLKKAKKVVNTVAKDLGKKLSAKTLTRHALKIVPHLGRFVAAGVLTAGLISRVKKLFVD